MNHSIAASTVVATTGPLLTFVDEWAEIRFNRPAVHNRLESGDFEILNRHLDAIEDHPACRAVVITGTGVTFSSGSHIGELLSPGGGPALFAQLANRIEQFVPITIARLNGSVYGGATDLALACDFRVGVTGMQMFMPAARLGLHYYPDGMRRWVTRVGLGASKRFFLTGETFDDQALLAIGFLDWLVPPEQLDGSVAELLSRLGSAAPAALLGMKSALDALVRGEVDLAELQHRFEISLSSQDIREGVGAWLEKRKAAFVGR